MNMANTFIRDFYRLKNISTNHVNTYLKSVFCIHVLTKTFIVIGKSLMHLMESINESDEMRLQSTFL